MENRTSMKLQKQSGLPYTQVANEVLGSKNLSWKAKGIYAYLFSKPDGWDFSANRIKDESPDGRHTVLAALKELEQIGYLERKRRGDGRVEYLLRYAIQSPKTELGDSDPKSENRTVRKVHSAEIDTISKKDDPSKKDNTSNKDAVEQSSTSIPQVIKLFEGINPNYEEWYGNTTQRKAIVALLERVGFEKLSRVIKALPAITSQKTAPRITSPFELKRDWAKIGIFINQQKSNKKEILI